MPSWNQSGTSRVSGRQGIVAVEYAATDWQARRHLALIEDLAVRLSCDSVHEVLWVLVGNMNRLHPRYLAGREGRGKLMRRLFQGLDTELQEKILRIMIG